MCADSLILATAGLHTGCGVRGGGGSKFRFIKFYRSNAIWKCIYVYRDGKEGEVCNYA